MSQFPYRFFGEYIVRTPLFSVKKFRERTGKNYISDDELREIGSDPIFWEALYLASPGFYSELKQWLFSEKTFSEKDHDRLKSTLLKYYSRISSRCTPFGLFSSVGLGNFVDELQIINHNHPEKIRDTKLDMHLLVSLAYYFATQPEIRNQLLFYPNNTIYKVGKRIRYIEYEYTDGKREYIISSAPLSSELQQILNLSKQGKPINEIVEALVNEETTRGEAVEFIEELIDYQVLISELEANVSGNDFLENINTVLYRVGAIKEAETLISIKNGLNKLDLNIGNETRDYVEIEELVQSVFPDKEKDQNKTEYWKKHLFQTDLYRKDVFTLPGHLKKELKKGIGFLNKITPPYRNPHLENFKKAFYDRFETRKMPLVYVLDTELGIGYGHNGFGKGIHPYLDDLTIPGSEKQEISLHFNAVHQILNEKLQEVLSDKLYTIELSDEDFRHFTENWSDLPDTFSCIAEIISENNREKLFLETVGGSSAADLLGRFCSEKSKVRNLTKTITKKEEDLNPDYILAEIIHLPEARIGNVIRRPTLRSYEIPYLAKSVLSRENQIPIDDLHIYLKDDRIVLYSERLDKEVRPYLTNAHNYSVNSLPVYHFLCDLHSQNTRTTLSFDWGDLRKIYRFLPRIEYKNVILSKALWKVTEKEFAGFSVSTNHKNDDRELFLSELRIWRNKRRIPQWIQWVQSDNKLTVNLENYDFAKIFIDTVIRLKSVTIEEFLCNENTDFMHQFIFPVYNAKKEREVKNSNS